MPRMSVLTVVVSTSVTFGTRAPACVIAASFAGPS